ncbi:MAG: bifunctional phosphoribosylaminoimidazolecarboxamide formyltransferase/IMP cyclohydrolase, partial [Gammaproteobacteria bacterium]|nr:bifunctional phosphoribosylaminoimidazolecarboxamide formyltransferase/IMP cyclohydrolase [Gammaproteobacteria bacterium]
MSIVKTALLSVSDKTGLVDFARGLAALGVHILSTGGTARHLSENGIEVTEVSDYTGFPEIMNGRVKTLHPKIHAGILARRGIDDEVLKQHKIDAIDLLVVNLYPFQEVTAKPDTTMDVAIENIDIGGPTMLRAAAKNHAFVGVVVDPKDYSSVLQELKISQAQLSNTTLYRLACKTFAHTAYYDATISNYLNRRDEHGTLDIFPEQTTHQYTKIMDLRYGENPHQRAAFYRAEDDRGANIATANMLQGRPLSYNNIADADTALDTVKSFLDPACVIVKHANPCGVAIADDLSSAYEQAFACDSTSAFGGIIAINRPLTGQLARSIISKQFVEVVIAPEVEPDALVVFSAKKNVRILETGEWVNELKTGHVGKRVHGGLLLQDWDQHSASPDDLKTVTKREPTADEFRDLYFA